MGKSEPEPVYSPYWYTLKMTPLSAAVAFFADGRTVMVLLSWCPHWGQVSRWAVAWLALSRDSPPRAPCLINTALLLRALCPVNLTTLPRSSFTSSGILQIGCIYVRLSSAARQISTALARSRSFSGKRRSLIRRSDIPKTILSWIMLSTSANSHDLANLRRSVRE